MALTRAEYQKRYVAAHPEQRKETIRKSREKNHERILAYNRRWRAANPDKVREHQKHGHRMSEYGMSRAQFEAYMFAQNESCYLCEISFKDARPTVDHDHETGEIRALLCDRCNAMLGLSGDCIEMLHDAIVYLRSFRHEAT